VLGRLLLEGREVYRSRDGSTSISTFSLIIRRITGPTEASRKDRPYHAIANSIVFVRTVFPLNSVLVAGKKKTCQSGEKRMGVFIERKKSKLTSSKRRHFSLRQLDDILQEPIARDGEGHDMRCDHRMLDPKLVLELLEYIEIISLFERVQHILVRPAGQYNLPVQCISNQEQKERKKERKRPTRQL